MKQSVVHARGLDFHCLEAGEGPLVLCLHGFPDTARSFRHQLPVLAAAGFRAVAPYMRGYAPTDLAPDARYQTAALGLDAVALIEALGATTRSSSATTGAPSPRMAPRSPRPRRCGSSSRRRCRTGRNS